MQPLKNHVLVLFCLLAFAYAPSTASAQSPCHLLTSADPIPQGFGAAYNLFSPTQELLLKVDCGPASDITLQVGPGGNSLYIYKTAYEWTGSSWRELALSGQKGVGDWYVGSAATNLIPSEAQLEDNFVVAYTCVRHGSRWKCGCRDTSCSTSHWQLQAFTYAPPPPPPPSSDPGGSADDESTDDGTIDLANPKNYFTPGRVFPSPEQAPIKYPYLILTYSSPGGGFPATVSGNAWQSKPDQSWWSKSPHKIILGNRQVNFPSDGSNTKGGSESQYYTYFKQRLDQGYDGLALNEYSYSEGNGVEYQKNTYPALKRLQSEFPKALIVAYAPFFWKGGENVPSTHMARNHEAFDMLVSENYVNCDGAGGVTSFNVDLAGFYKKTDDAYKHHDLTGKAMVGISLGMAHKLERCPHPTLAQFNAMLTQIRKTFPYAPHLFLWHKGHIPLWDSYMASIKREFFEKSPSANISSPANGATLSKNSNVTITASGSPNGTTGSAVDHYRFFVGNKLMAVQNSPTWAWNTGNSSGNVVLTVHAVARDYLTGVNQVTVNVK